MVIGSSKYFSFFTLFTYVNMKFRKGDLKKTERNK